MSSSSPAAECDGDLDLVKVPNEDSGGRVNFVDDMVKVVPPAARATPPLLKHLNERTVLEAIRSGAPISRAEISRRAGISKPTVSLALQSLVGDGLVREAATAPGGPSYGAVF